MLKRKILLCNQMHYASSGFGTYGKEILTRLHDSDKFEIAEFAFDAKLSDRELYNSPWKVYPCAVDTSDPRYKEYKSNPANARGEWRFEKVLVDFKPDIVFSIEDIWNIKILADSPLRPYFHFVPCPTYDSKPYRPDWIELLENADACFTYSQFGFDGLKEQSKNINLLKPLWSGVDLEEFKPTSNKAELRAKFGLSEDIFIVGMVARNQNRKLFPDLFKAFRQFLENAVKSGRKDIADKTYLYIHTSYPDNGWNIPEILLENDIAHKTLFTYVCEETKQVYISFFQDALAVNPITNRATLNLPSVKNGVSRKQLADIYNLFDFYMQPCTCEGLGMPVVEALCCGVPIAATNYSATADLIKMSSGFPLKTDRMWLNHNTSSYRAYPSISDMSDRLLTFFSATKEYRDKLGDKARKVAEQYFDWDKIAQDWSDYFEAAKLTGKQGQWNSPPNLLSVPENLPKLNTNSEFIEWLYKNLLKTNGRCGHKMLQSLQDLNYGIIAEGKSKTKVNREILYKVAIKRIKEHNFFEKMRCGQIRMEQEDFIAFANREK